MAKALKTKIKGKPIASRSSKEEIENAKSLSLDQIEQEMEKIATTETTDFSVMMANETRMNMLEKVANFKLKRLQLKELEKPQKEKKAEPITIKFVNSQDEEQKKRLEQIDKAVLENKNITPNA